MLRKPAVAGSFYYSNPKDLEESIEYSFLCESGVGSIPKLNKSFNSNLKGIMVPHAGYIYSGPVASYSFSKLVENGFPDTFIILCPNHTGFGSGYVSVFDEGMWETPLGNVEVDSDLADIFIKNSKYADVDYQAHYREHSIEVELPFLQYFSDDFKILPICINVQNLQTSLDIADSIRESVEEISSSILLISSTDLSHFLSQDTTLIKDEMVLNDIANMNHEKLLDDVSKYNITMCGYGTVASNIIYSKECGVSKADILKHQTSGDVSGDYSSVVGYGAGVFKSD